MEAICRGRPFFRDSSHGGGESSPRGHHAFKEGKDACQLLGVTRESTPKVYRRKCLEWHPDKWGTKPEAEQKKAEEAGWRGTSFAARSLVPSTMTS